MKNVTPGLTLYLFNYTDRKLHGVFEAVSTGQRNIDPHGWAYSEGVEFTPFPSQVRKPPIDKMEKRKKGRKI